MKMKPTITTFAVVHCLLCLAVQSSFASQPEIRSEFHQTYPLAPNGKIMLDNVNGKIHITGWDQSEVKVDAVKLGDKQSDVDEIKIEIDAKADKIKIRTKYPNRKSFRGKSNSPSVDYELKVPIQAILDNIQNVNGSIEIEGVQGSIHASTVNGRLHVDGIASDASLESVNGGVHAGFTILDTVKRASLKTVNGGVALTLPAGADADVSAHTLNGSIQSDSGLLPKKNWPVGTDLHRTLGKGGAHIKAETVNGSIQIRLAKSGKETSETTHAHTGQKLENE
jgi:DUF4097 and DUF4098 domain-containing protein YvlB